MVHVTDSTPSAIRRIMVEKGMTLSTAESCTSGRMAAMLTSVSGASDYFQGGLVAYQNWVKVEQLGVSQQIIDEFDVVSRQVVEQMVVGACQLFKTDYALASTGYAGGGTDTIPDGTIWIAWGSQTEVHSLCLTTDNGREANTQNAAETCLRKFLEFMELKEGLE